MASVASQLMEEVTAHAQSDSLEDARETCADGTYFPNSLRILDYVMFDASMDTGMTGCFETEFEIEIISLAIFNNLPRAIFMYFITVLVWNVYCN